MRCVRGCARIETVVSFETITHNPCFLPLKNKDLIHTILVFCPKKNKDYNLQKIALAFCAKKCALLSEVQLNHSLGVRLFGTFGRVLLGSR